MYPGFKSQESHDFYYYYYYYYYFFFFFDFFGHYYYSAKFQIHSVSTQILLLYYPLWCPGLQRLQRFDFFFDSSSNLYYFCDEQLWKLFTVFPVDILSCQDFIFFSAGGVGTCWPTFWRLLSLFYGTPEGKFLFQYLPENKLKQKKIGKEIKTIISRINDLSSFLSNIEQNRN